MHKTVANNSNFIYFQTDSPFPDFQKQGTPRAAGYSVGLGCLVSYIINRSPVFVNIFRSIAVDNIQKTSALRFHGAP